MWTLGLASPNPPFASLTGVHLPPPCAAGRELKAKQAVCLRAASFQKEKKKCSSEMVFLSFTRAGVCCVSRFAVFLRPRAASHMTDPSARMLSHLTLATPWTAAHRAPLSMGFSRQEYRSRLPFPLPGDLPNLRLLCLLHLQADSCTTEPQGKSLTHGRYPAHIWWVKVRPGQGRCLPNPRGGG